MGEIMAQRTLFGFENEPGQFHRVGRSEGAVFGKKLPESRRGDVIQGVIASSRACRHEGDGKNSAWYFVACQISRWNAVRADSFLAASRGANYNTKVLPSRAASQMRSLARKLRRKVNPSIMSPALSLSGTSAAKSADGAPGRSPAHAALPQ